MKTDTWNCCLGGFLAGNFLSPSKRILFEPRDKAGWINNAESGSGSTMRPRFHPTEISRIDHYLGSITFDFHETSGTAREFFDLSTRATPTRSEGFPPDYTIVINTDHHPIVFQDSEEGLNTLPYLTCFNHGGTELGENNPMSKVRWLALRGRGRSVSSIPSTCCLTAHYPPNHTP